MILTVLLCLWLASALGFGAFWALTGSVLTRADAPDETDEPDAGSPPEVRAASVAGERVA